MKPMLPRPLKLVQISLMGLIGWAFALSAQAKVVTVTAMAHNDTPAHMNAKALPYANLSAPEGGVLSQAANGTFDHFNPFIDQGSAATELYLVHESLMQQSLDEAFSMYPLLAESATYDTSDASWIIYNLNPKARFSDGSKVTAKDVVFTYESLLSRGAIFYRNYLSAVKSVKALDDHRVRFDFQDASNEEIKMVVAQIPITSHKVGDQFDKVSLKPLLGSGPYTVGHFQPGRVLNYNKNPNYWGKDLLVNLGANNFDRLTFRYFRSSEVAFEAFKAGQYALREENKARNWAVNYTFPAVKQGLVKKVEIENFRPMVMQAFIINQRKPLFRDIRVREALILAYDFEWMNRTLFYSGYRRLHSYFQNSELEATGKPTQAELKVLRPLLPMLGARQKQNLLNPQPIPVSDGSGFNRSNLLKARKLLLEAGFSYRGTQLVDPKGKPVAIELLNYTSDLNRIFLPYVQNLKRLGIDAQIRVVDMPQFSERVRNFDFDMMLGQFAQSLSPGQEQIDYWGSSAADQPGSRNIIGLKNPAIDQLIDQIAKAENRKQLVTLSRALDRLLVSGAYVVPTYGTPSTRVAYWRSVQPPKVTPKYALGLMYWWSSDAPAPAKLKQRAN